MPPLGESIQRRRVFWFLVALVVVPVVLLAFYGLAGVKDRRDAAEARLRERHVLQARTVEAEIVARLAEEDGRVRAALADVGEADLTQAIARLTSPSSVVARAWRVDPATPELGEAARRLTAADPLTFLTHAQEGEPRGVVAVSRVRDGLVVAYRLDPRVIDAVVLPAIVGRLFPSERATYRIRVDANRTVAEPISLDAVRQAVANRLTEEEPLVERAMAEPFAEWRIVIEPLVGAGGRTWSSAWIVVVLSTTSVVGVVLMGRAVAQQARLSRLQTDFVSNVSHELRTPLTSIRMFIETLQSGRVTDPAQVKECLDVIATESDRLTRKIERVLGWARMEAGRRMYEMQPVRPRDLAEQTVEAFRTQQIGSDAQLDLDVPADLPLVKADPDAMVEALLNLVTNAHKYGGNRVRIRIEGRAGPRGTVDLAVIDDGPGIPRAERARVFEKFYRPDVLVSRRAEGSGLGLAIVHGIVAAHGGAVTLDSEIGRGSRFTVRLRRV